MQFDIALLLGSIGLLIVLVFIVGVIIYSIFLGIALGFVNGQNREFGTVFVTALLIAIVSLIPILGCILAWYFIKTRHEVGWGGAIAAWLITFIIEAIVLLAIIFLLFPGLLALLIPAIPSTTTMFP